MADTLTPEQLASRYTRDELDNLARAAGIEDPESYDTKGDVADALLEAGYQDKVPSANPTSFEAVNPEGMAVVNTPLNKFGLPDPERVVTAAYRSDDGDVTYEGGDE